MPISKRKLSEDGWDGYYRTDKGFLIEMHEWEDWFDSDELEEGDEPDGAVYYDIFENGDVVDGGVIGYRKGDDIAYFNKWLDEAHNGQYGRITGLVALETSSKFDKIDSMRYESASAFAKLCRSIGLKNRKGFKDRYKGKGDVETLARHVNEAANMSDPYGYVDEFSSSETQGFYPNEEGYNFFLDGLTNGDKEYFRRVEKGLADSIECTSDKKEKRMLWQAHREVRRRRKQLFGRKR